MRSTSTGITGELELHNTNGPIRARGVRGPVTANTVNGDVEVVFAPGAVIGGPMAFSTLNGDVDLTLPDEDRRQPPPAHRAGRHLLRLRRRAHHRARAHRARRARQNKYRITIAKELVGKIGAGGPELFLKSFNGDIVLRQTGGS